MSDAILIGVPIFVVVVLLVWLMVFVTRAQRRAIAGIPQKRDEAQQAFNDAISKMVERPADPQLRAMAVELGHTYYKWVGAYSIRVAKQLSDGDYLNDQSARDNRVQADISARVAIK